MSTATLEKTSTPIMVTIRELANEVGLSYDSIRKKCLRGEIVFIKNGNRFLVNRPKFYEYLNSGASWDN